MAVGTSHRRTSVKLLTQTQVVTAILQSASGGGVRTALATGALETCSDAVCVSALASCAVSGPKSITRALDASWRASVAAALGQRNGQCALSSLTRTRSAGSGACAGLVIGMCTAGRDRGELVLSLRAVWAIRRPPGSTRSVSGGCTPSPLAGRQCFGRGRVSVRYSTRRDTGKSRGLARAATESEESSGPVGAFLA